MWNLGDFTVFFWNGTYIYPPIVRLSRKKGPREVIPQQYFVLGPIQSKDKLYIPVLPFNRLPKRDTKAGYIARPND